MEKDVHEIICRVTLHSESLREELVNIRIPLQRDLLESIQRAVQVTHCTSRVNLLVPAWLLHEHILLELTVEEGMHHIHLIQKKIMHCHY